MNILLFFKCIIKSICYTIINSALISLNFTFIPITRINITFHRTNPKKYFPFILKFTTYLRDSHQKLICIARKYCVIGLNAFEGESFKWNFIVKSIRLKLRFTENSFADVWVKNFVIALRNWLLSNYVEFMCDAFISWSSFFFKKVIDTG